MTESSDASYEANNTQIYRKERDLLFNKEGVAFAPALIRNFMYYELGGDVQILQEKKAKRDRINMAWDCEMLFKVKIPEKKLTKEQWELPERVFYTVIALPTLEGDGTYVSFIENSGFKPDLINQFITSVNHNPASRVEPGFTSPKVALTNLISIETDSRLKDYYTLARSALNNDVQIPEHNWKNIIRRGILYPEVLDNPLQALQALLSWASIRNREGMMAEYDRRYRLQ